MALVNNGSAKSAPTPSKGTGTGRLVDSPNANSGAWNAYLQKQQQQQESQAKIAALSDQADQYKAGSSVWNQFKSGVADLGKSIGNGLKEHAVAAIHQSPVQSFKDVVNGLTSSEQNFNKGVQGAFKAIPQVINQDANEKIFKQEQDANNKIVAALHATKDPVQKAHLTELLNTPSHMLDTKELQDLMTPAQMLGATGGVLLDVATLGLGSTAGKAAIKAGAADIIKTAAEQGVEMSAKEALAQATKDLAVKVATETSTGKTLKVAGVGATYGADQSVQSGQTSASDIATGAAMGAATGLALHGAGVVAGKVLPKGAGKIETTPVEGSIPAQNGPAGFEVPKTDVPSSTPGKPIAQDVGIKPAAENNPALGHDVILDGEAPNKFAYHAATSPDLSTEAQLNIVLGSHEVRNTKALGEEADALVKKDAGKAYDLALKGDSDKSTAAAISLIKHYGALGDKAKAAGDAVAARENYDQMAHIAEVHAENATKAGRTVQANTLLASMSPEGQVSRAARAVAKQGEKIASPEKVAKTAREVSTSVEKAPVAEHGNISKESTSKTIKAVEEKTNGQKLAKKIEGDVNPKKKTPTNNLVNELFKQVKAESLPEKAKGTAKAPIDIIKEVFARNDESKAAFAEAKTILQEKFKNSPKMLDALEKFSQSEFSRPNSPATTARAVAAELRARETDIASIVKKSLSEQKTSVEDIAKAMTDKGFSKDAAAQFAKEVQSHLTERVNARKASILEQMRSNIEKKNPRAAATLQDKITKLSNTGALTERDYLDIAKHQLKLPELSGEHAQAIHQFAQTMQDHPTGREYANARLGLMETMEKAIGKEPINTVGKALGAISDATKSAGASFDNSVNFRQLLSAYVTKAFRNPVDGAKIFGKSMRLLVSDLTHREGALRDVRESILSSPNVHEYDKMGIAPGIKNDTRPVNLEKLPILGRAFRASEAAFQGTAELMRASLADDFLKMADQAGIDKNENNWYKSTGRYIMTQTGSGDTHAGKLVGSVIWSPKSLVANFDKLTGDVRHYGTNHPMIRKQAALDSLRFIGVVATTIAIANKLSPGSAEPNPISADFGKIKIGDTRFDITGGAAGLVTLAARIATHSTKSTTDGQVSDLWAGGYGKQNLIDIITTFGENKFSPLASTTLDVLKHQDRNGNPITVGSELGPKNNPLVPLPFKTGQELLNDKNSAPFIAAMIADALGISTNTYDQGQSKPGVAGVRAQVKEALIAGDQEKAQQLINDNFVASDRKTEMTNSLKAAALSDSSTPTEAVDFYKSYTPARTERSGVVTKAKALVVQGKAAEANRLVGDYNNRIGDLMKPYISKYGSKGASATKIKSLTIPPIK